MGERKTGTGRQIAESQPSETIACTMVVPPAPASTAIASGNMANTPRRVPPDHEYITGLLDGDHRLVPTRPHVHRSPLPLPWHGVDRDFVLMSLT